MTAPPATVVRFVVAFFLCGLPAVVGAQSPSAVTVLIFEGEVPDPGLRVRLFNGLRTQIEFHREFALNDVPPQSLDDLMLAVGCAELDATCSTLLADIVGTRLLAWGVASADDERLYFEMTLWDLQQARAVRVREFSVALDDVDALERDLAIVARSLLYGEDYTLRVSTEPAGAWVTVDGVGVATSPSTFDGLPLGLYEVYVELEAHEPERRLVTVDLDGGELGVVMTPLVRERDRAERLARESGAALDAAPWAVVGVGGVLAVAGIAVGGKSRSTQREFDRVTSAQELDRARAEALQEEGSRQTRTSNALLVVGAATIVVGAVWRVLSVSERESTDSEAEARRRLTPWFDQSGGGLVFSSTL